MSRQTVNRRRTVILSALACLLAVTAAAPGAAVSASASGASASGGSASTSASATTARGAKSQASRLDLVPRRGVLRVCTTGDYRPFTYRDPGDGSYSGIDIDMVKDLAKSLDATASFVQTTWANLVTDLTAGKCDIAAGGVSVTLARARQVYFSETTGVDGKAPIVRCEDKDKYQTLEDIDTVGTTVIVNPGGTNEEFARANIKNATIKVHSDNTTIFDEIVEGRADVMITDASETRYQSKLHPELCSVHPDQPFTFSEKAYATPRGDRDFQEYVSQFVHLATHDGTYAAYESEWMS